MASTEPADRETAPAPTPLPLWVAALLVQVGSFAIVLGLGVVILSFAYGAGSSLLGVGLVAGGYAAVGFPAWYLAKMPTDRSTVRRVTARLRELRP